MSASKEAKGKQRSWNNQFKLGKNNTSEQNEGNLTSKKGECKLYDCKRVCVRQSREENGKNAGK